jgi:hypothetical protein
MRLLRIERSDPFLEVCINIRFLLLVRTRKHDQGHAKLLGRPHTLPNLAHYLKVTVRTYIDSQTRLQWPFLAPCLVTVFYWIDFRLCFGYRLFFDPLNCKSRSSVRLS